MRSGIKAEFLFSEQFQAGIHSGGFKPLSAMRFDFFQRYIDAQRRAVGTMTGYCLNHIRNSYDTRFQVYLLAL